MADGARKRRFEAVLTGPDRALGWITAPVPFRPADVWPKMVRLRVCGTINGFAFRTSLFPQPGEPGSYFLLVNRRMQQGADVRSGEQARFALEPDLQERAAELPDMLAVLLDEEDGLRAFYDDLTEYTRREIGKWVLGVKHEEAQLRRAQQMAERLMLTMEGERELPPMLEAAFQRRPRARKGWERMTPAQRRNGLMAVFYYQTPEARARRAEKLVDAAEERAD